MAACGAKHERGARELGVAFANEEQEQPITLTRAAYYTNKSSLSH
jgi:hypothetical protein